MAIQTFTSGQILTAAQMTALQAQAVMTFTTEAARDAALTAPTEGMVAYLTAPTIPTLTGGALTQYNGSVWVCLSAESATVTTFEQTSTEPFTNLATVGPAVTLVTGTTALVTICASGNFPSGQNGWISFAVSGATTLAASEGNGTFGGGGSAALNGSLSRTLLVTGLTAGTNIFTMKYQSGGGVTTGFRNRSITVSGVV